MEQLSRDKLEAEEHTQPFLQIEHFEPHVGKLFRFEGTRFAFPLLKVLSNDRPVPTWLKRRPFTLIFCAPREREWLPEGLYRCSIADGPTYVIHVAPIHTPQPDVQDYQAIFN